MGRLAGGVAHDFNNMLGVILSLTELELLELDPALPLAESLRAIQNAALRSSGLTKQLMAFARRQAIAPKVLDLNATVAGMLAMLQRVIGEDISLQWRPGALQGRVKLDPVQVDQLLANLCVNARDAIVGVGQVLIETADVELDGPYCAAHGLPEPGAHVRLSVSDNGSGMPAAVLERIFEPFFTTKGPGKGTGLGLATVYGIVRQNRGAIEVQSSLGQGSRFDIYLPCQAGPADPVEAPREALGPSLSAAVLLVEDEPELLRACGSMLRRLGCTVVEAASPQQALDWEADHAGALDLLLTDLVMPGLSGGDLARALRARRPGLPVLYMSGYTANIISDHGVLEDGVNFLPKPFTLEQLRDKLVQALTAPLC